MPKKKCDVAGCNELVPFRQEHCEDHKAMDKSKVYEKYRYANDKKVRSVYNRVAWKNTRRSVLMRDNYTCLYCLYRDELIVPASMVDHFMPVRDAYDDRYDMSQLISCCSQCNTLKYYDEVRLRNNDITIEEYKDNWNYIIEDD